MYTLADLFIVCRTRCLPLSKFNVELVCLVSVAETWQPMSDSSLGRRGKGEMTLSNILNLECNTNCKHLVSGIQIAPYNLFVLKQNDTTVKVCTPVSQQRELRVEFNVQEI